MGYQKPRFPDPAAESSAGRKRMRKEFVERLDTFGFTFAITLGFNHLVRSPSWHRARLRTWDASLNRYLNGSSWVNRPDERIIWIAFPEKFEVNPHWHLVAAPDPLGFHDQRAQRYADFTRQVVRKWLGLVPTGTARCTRLVGGEWNWYITKEFNAEDFVLSTEFQSN